MSEKRPRNQEEDLYRQILFQKARKGDEQAAQQLQKLYGVRLWSENERSKWVYDAPQPEKRKARKA